MGKKSLKKDRGYITATEWQTEWGGHKDKTRSTFKCLPFYCCAISFTPFEDPACTVDGTTYDITNIVPYVMKFKKHPVTGDPLSLKDVVKLNFHKNSDGEYMCPVLNKVFTEHTHIVAIRTTGNVYCWEAVEELNIKPKYWKDLLDDTPFVRKDIIHLQDPLNLQAKNLENFDHVKKNLSLEDADALAAQEADPMFSIKTEGLSEDMKRVMSKLNTADATKAFEQGGGGRKAQAARLLAEAHSTAQKGNDKAEDTTQNGARSGPDPRLQPPKAEDRPAATFKPGTSTWNTDDPDQAPPWVREKMRKEMEKGTWRGQDKEAEAAKAAGPGAKPVPKPYMTAQYREDSMRTTGAASRSFTSTAVNVTTQNARSMVRVERCPKKKGYMRLHTSLGDLNLELHCDIAPRACENFFVLAEGGYYTDTIFHRSIRSFMIQGGDPTGTGTGGESIYGPTFKDELDSRLTHTGRGVLSMANSGPNTNGSQFFILYKSAHHLDFKHTVFGRVVGGFEVLTAMEKVPTDDDDRPLQEIKIKGATVFVNPYKEEEEAERKAAEEARLKAEREAGPPTEEEKVGSWFSNPAAQQSTAGKGTGVGKYLNVQAVRKAASSGVDEGAPGPPAKKSKQASYGNFDAW
ncbi:Peptidyl-prolyl cis-trans isomerase-like 2 [Coccomyxa sp. Obi]|nr:Peptidyl-prolyl cis-trans isomerase-like 2 [Coccomyxa sp. Obi]